LRVEGWEVATRLAGTFARSEGARRRRERAERRG